MAAIFPPLRPDLRSPNDTPQAPGFLYTRAGVIAIGVGVTGAGENGVFRWEEAEAALAGNFSPDAIEGLSVSAEGLMGDIHATPEYRAHLIKVMTKRAVAACA